jgi:hypothetical protein
MAATAVGRPLHLSIFLSSPGDVAEVREAARSTLAEIAGRPLLKGLIFIDVVSWDDPRSPSPLAITETPQLSVNRYTGRPADCDLTVVMLGGRLGTPLPSHIRRADGSSFASGTVWEYEDAREAGKEVWLYRRLTAGDRTSLPRPERDQHQAVDGFLAQFRNPDGSLAGAYHEFASTDDFADRFARDVESFVRVKLDAHKASQIDGYRLPFVNELRLGEGLVGRTEVLAALDAFQASHPAGYFVLKADAGLGKTAFAAAVAQRRGALAFFASRARGLTQAAQCLNHLSAELISRFGLPYTALPLRSGEDSTFFERLLREAADVSGDPLWIVVDALDEADVESGRNALGLPSALPATVHVLLTQRPGDDLVTTDALTPAGRYELTADSGAQQADILAFLRREAARPEIARALRAAYPARDADGVIADLARLSEGNFLYLTHVLRDIAAGESWVRSAEGRVFLPEGLKGYYGDIWARMGGITQAEGVTDWRTLYRPVIGLLAVAREAVTPAWLAEISGCDIEDIQNPVLSRWRSFLTQERHAGQTRWRILHRSFGEFVAGKLDLESRHAAVSRHFEEKSRWASHNHYASRHLCSHLERAGDLDRLGALLRNPDWYINQITQDPSGLRYASDAQAQRSLASRLNERTAAEGQPAPALAHEAEAALLLSTIAGFWSLQRLDAVEPLLDLGIMSTRQVLDIIVRLSDKQLRLKKQWLVTLVTKDPACAPVVTDMARGLPPEYGAEVLLAIAQQRSSDDRDALVQEALLATRTLEDEEADKRDLLVNLAGFVAAPERDACLRHALALAGRIEDPLDQASALSKLVGDVPDALPSLLDSLERAGAFLAGDGSDAGNPGETFQTIVDNVPEVQRPRIAGPALRVAMEIRDPSEQTLALAALLPVIDAADRSRVSAVALDAARSIGDTAIRAERLLDLTRTLPDSERARVVAEAEALILDDPEPLSRLQGLMRLAQVPGESAPRHLTRALSIAANEIPPADAVSSLTAAAEELPNVMAEATLAAARNLVSAIPERLGRARALIEMALAWPLRKAELFHDAMRIPGWFLAIGLPQEDALERVELLGRLLAHLDGADRDDLVRQATGLAAALERPYDRARGQSALLPFLEPREQRQAIDEIRRYADETARADERAELLIGLARHVAADARDVLRDEALQAVERIGPGDASVTGSVNMVTGFVRIDNMPDIMGRPSLALLRVARDADPQTRDRLLARAVERLFQTSVSLQQVELTELAPYLPPATVRALLAEYRDLRHDPMRGVFGEAIASRIRSAQATSSDEVALEAPSAETDEEDDGGAVPFQAKVRPLDQLFRLSGPPYAPVVEIQFEDSVPAPPVDIVSERDIVGEVAAGLVADLASDDLERLHADAQEVDGSGWQRPVALLLERLAAAESPQVALEEACLIWPEAIPPTVAAMIARWAPAPRDRTFVDDARSRADSLPPAERALVLALTLPRLEREGFSHAVEELVSLSRQLSAADAEKVLEAVADDRPALPAIVRLTLVQARLHGIDERRDLLEALGALLPVLTGLSRAGFVRALADAVVRTGAWIR